MNCFQRSTRIEALGSGAPPLHVASASAVRLLRRPVPASPAVAAPDLSIPRLVISLICSSLDGASGARSSRPCLAGCHCAFGRTKPGGKKGGPAFEFEYVRRVRRARRQMLIDCMEA